MADRRVYPAKLAKRERDLLAMAADTIETLERAGNERAVAVVNLIRHRLACAARFDEMREKRLTEYERLVTSHAMCMTLRVHVEDGNAEEARAVTRALVRLMR